MTLIERIEGELLDAMHARAVANAEGRTDAPSVRDMAVKAASIADDHYRGAVEALNEAHKALDRAWSLDNSEADPAKIDVGDALDRAVALLGGQRSSVAYPRKEQP